MDSNHRSPASKEGGAALIELHTLKGYDQAMALLVDLRDVAAR